MLHVRKVHSVSVKMHQKSFDGRVANMFRQTDVKINHTNHSKVEIEIQPPSRPGLRLAYALGPPSLTYV